MGLRRLQRFTRFLDLVQLKLNRLLGNLPLGMLDRCARSQHAAMLTDKVVHLHLPFTFHRTYLHLVKPAQGVLDQCMDFRRRDVRRVLGRHGFQLLRGDGELGGAELIVGDQPPPAPESTRIGANAGRPGGIRVDIEDLARVP